MLDKIMRNLAILAATGLILSFAASSQDAPKKGDSPDRWAAVRFMVGEWTASASGEPGEGTVKRTYEFVLKDQFIQERNVTTYPPQTKNPKGEIHEHWGFISFDKKRQTPMLRQFHQESFVIVYAFNPAASTPKRLVFESESFENFDSSWKGKETYDILSNDEFIETFELAAPGKPFEVYSKSHFKRIR